MSILAGVRHQLAAKAMQEAKVIRALEGALRFRTGAYRLTTLTMIRQRSDDVRRIADRLLDPRLP